MPRPHSSTRPSRRGTPRGGARCLARWPAYALLIAHAAGAAEPVFIAHYELEAYGTTVGHVIWQLSNDGAGMTLDSRSETAGVAALVRDVEELERSELRWFDGILKPVHYRFQRRGDKRARLVELTLDWARRTVHGNGPTGPFERPLPRAALDELSWQLAMIADLRAGERHLEYLAATNGGVEPVTLAVQGSETLDTSLGRIDTVIVRRLRRDERATAYWCAPSLGYMPLRVLHEERDGWSLDMRIRTLTGRPPENLRFK